MSAVSQKVTVHHVTKKAAKDTKGKVPAAAAAAAVATAKPVASAKGKGKGKATAKPKVEAKVLLEVPATADAAAAWAASFEKIAVQKLIHNPKRSLNQILSKVGREIATECFGNDDSKEAKEFIAAFVKDAANTASSLPVYVAALALYQQFHAGGSAASASDQPTPSKVNGLFGHVVYAVAAGGEIFVNVNSNGERTPDHVPKDYAPVHVNGQQTPIIVKSDEQFQSFLDQMPEGFSFTDLVRDGRFVSKTKFSWRTKAADAGLTEEDLVAAAETLDAIFAPAEGEEFAFTLGDKMAKATKSRKSSKKDSATKVGTTAVLSAMAARKAKAATAAAAADATSDADGEDEDDKEADGEAAPEGEEEEEGEEYVSAEDEPTEAEAEDASA